MKVIEKAQIRAKKDLDYTTLLAQARLHVPLPQSHTSTHALPLSVSVLKRPLFPNEEYFGDLDLVSCANPNITLHLPQLNHFINHTYTFDNVFTNTTDVYKHQIQGLLP